MKGKRAFMAERKIERGKVRLGAARGGGEKERGNEKIY